MFSESNFINNDVNNNQEKWEESSENDSSQEDDSLSQNSVEKICDLGKYDILCGRSKTAFNHVGNRRFRVTCKLSLPRYMAAPTRKDKSIVIKSVAALVRENGGRFFQVGKAGVLTELTEKQSHEKVGHALRDQALAIKNRSESEEVRCSNASSRSSSPCCDNLEGSSTNDDVFEPLPLEFAVNQQFDKHVGTTSSNTSSTPPSSCSDNFEGSSTNYDVFEPLPLEFAVNQNIVCRINHVRPENTNCKDDNMITWLVGESDMILDALETI